MTYIRPPVEAVYKRIGANIKQARKRAGMSQTELAKQTGADAGLTRSHLANMERGEQRIWPHQLLKVARALGVHASILMEGIW